MDGWDRTPEIDGTIMLRGDGAADPEDGQNAITSRRAKHTQGGGTIRIAFTHLEVRWGGGLTTHVKNYFYVTRELIEQNC